MEILLLWIIAAIIIGVVAGCRGRSGVGWFLFSLLLSPLFGLIFVVCLPNLKAQAIADKRHKEMLMVLAAARGPPPDGIIDVQPTSSVHPIIEGIAPSGVKGVNWWPLFVLLGLVLAPMIWFIFAHASH